MAQLCWFFAGTSFGLFTGVLLVCLFSVSAIPPAREEEEFLEPEPPGPDPDNLIVMRH